MDVLVLGEAAFVLQISEASGMELEDKIGVHLEALVKICFSYTLFIRHIYTPVKY